MGASAMRQLASPRELRAALELTRIPAQVLVHVRAEVRAAVLAGPAVPRHRAAAALEHPHDLLVDRAERVLGAGVKPDLLAHGGARVAPHLAADVVPAEVGRVVKRPDVV